MSDITDATIATIEKALAQDGVWIDPGFAKDHDLTAADETAMERAVADADEANLHVVLIDIDDQDARFGGEFANLSAWIHDDMGGDVTYVGPPERGLDEVSLYAYGEQPSTLYAEDVVAADHPGDLTAQVVALPELLADGNASEIYSQRMREEEESSGGWGSADAGESVGAAPVVLGVLVALGAVTAALVAWRRRRQRKPRPFTLPRTVLHTVRAAEDRRLRADADAEVLALGEALGDGEPSGSPAALTAWQAALDHYAAASAILAQEPTPADVVGALVLARRGEDARTTAQQESPATWTAPARCWFHPLHEGSAEQVAWRDGDREVDVPACDRCATAAREGREPDDILDFIEKDRTVHYFRLDLGAWTRTGYGTVGEDLLAALNADGGSSRRTRRDGTAG